uniref:Uncharacterized protein n=1 Tax=Monodelphis domestica TaxID=13616 RepID=A0A5F8GT86_MONDO
MVVSGESGISCSGNGPTEFEFMTLYGTVKQIEKRLCFNVKIKIERLSRRRSCSYYFNLNPFKVSR